MLMDKVTEYIADYALRCYERRARLQIEQNEIRVNGDGSPEDYVRMGELEVEIARLHGESEASSKILDYILQQTLEVLNRGR